MSATPESAPTPSQSVEELARFVNLPLRPASVVWQRKVMGGNHVSDIPGPTDWMLTAVLLYNAEDADKVAAAASKIELGVPDQLEAQTWFPAELLQLAAPDAEPKMLAVQRFRPDDYRRAPLLNGSLTRVNKTNYFVLNLFTT